MLFNTASFFLFLGAVLVVFYASPRSWRRVILLIASYYFYASWNPKFVPLLLTLTVLDYAAGIWIARSTRFRKGFLVISLCCNLGFLGFFKYYNFLVDNFVHLFHLPPGTLALAITLPLGISFHTFQSMSYVIDVYRKEQEPIRNPIDYALFIAFFPQLVAGPIVRAREFFSDLYQWRKPSGDEILQGVLLVVLGLTKKMVFADQLSLIADSYFGNIPAHPGIWTAWTGVIAFALQIFFDFSGYTDMAIGMALLFGFHFPVNFRRPYLAFSITEFWHRWHISLSRWLRDYLYIPLGGNRHGKWKTYRNLMLTMLLGGLWHGASWNFVFWGGYHGALLSVERMLGRSSSARWPWYPLRVVKTFILVCIGWVFFRAATFVDSVRILRQMFTWSTPGQSLIPTWLFALVGIALIIALAEDHWEWIDRIPRAPSWVYAAVVVVLLFSIELLGVTDKPIPFVYFQF